jgi:hypothetical protein
MDTDWNAEVVDQLESHWRHQLRPRLDGLTDHEYFWQPVPGCRTISRRAESSAPVSFGAGEFTMDYGQPRPNPEPVTTIAWRLGHLIAGFAESNASHFGGPPADVSTFTYAGTAKEALEQLDREHGTYVQGVRSLGTTGLIRPQGSKSPPEFADAPMAKLFLYINVEVIHPVCAVARVVQRPVRPCLVRVRRLRWRYRHWGARARLQARCSARGGPRRARRGAG